MADFPTQGAYVGGVNALLTERSGAAISTDTVPAGALIVARNTGVGAHTVILACNFTVDGLAVASRTHNFAASDIRGFRVPNNYGDANGRVAMYVGEASQTEIKYYVIGA
jgi:hypothetical protein